MDCFDAAEDVLRKFYNMRFIGSQELRVAILGEELVLKNMEQSKTDILKDLDKLYEQEKEQDCKFIASVIAEKQMLYNYVHHMIESRKSALAHGREVLADLVERGY